MGPFTWIAAILSTVVATEVVLRSPLRQLGTHGTATAAKSLRVTTSRRISDHWKEKVLLRYARMMLSATAQTLAWGLLCAVVCGSTYAVVHALGGVRILLAPGLWPTVAAICIGITYASLRQELIASWHCRSERWLHYIALGNTPVRELSFDLESVRCRSLCHDPLQERPVFVCGLARSGTSILLRILYGTGHFVTQTYRDMPFVLAPNSWQRFTRWDQCASQKRERTHGDGLTVDFDTPEAFEEVFWLTYCHGYVRDHHLLAHEASADTIERFRRFVTHVMAAHGNEKRRRYLSKNNNNLLRLTTLSRAYPNCCVLIPFRRPLDHASSLLRQHQRFRKLHERDRYAAKYMSWLGHYEFGLDVRPFVFGKQPPPHLSQEILETIDYWLMYWTRTYQHVAELLSDENGLQDFRLFDYDRFCQRPRQTLQSFSQRVQVPAADLLRLAGQISTPRPCERPAEMDQTVLSRAEATHQWLRDLADDGSRHQRVA